MGGLRECFKKYISLFSNVSDKEYVTIQDYRKELDNVKDELVFVEDTINYYKSRQKALHDWEHELELLIATYDKLDNCCNCKYYTQLYCSLFDSSVDADATCSSFEWSDDAIKLK